MSYYYKYNFISPEIIYASIKEEMKSYFDTGAIDDLMFPTYTDKCLRKLGRSSYVISNEILNVEDFEARLPDNFYAVREAWLCTHLNGYSYQSPNSFYSQSYTNVIAIDPVTTDIVPCTNNCPPDACTCNEPLIYKTNGTASFAYKKQYLLTPGNISVRGNCTLDCLNFGASSIDSFDIRDNKFVTNFRHGTVYLVFYALEYDNNNNQLIPDNYRIREYIEAFIKYKMFETLSNQINDETYKQIQDKVMYYKQLADEAYILAESEIKKQTAYQKIRAIKNNLNRFNMYELPTRTNRYGLWRRNS